MDGDRSEYTWLNKCIAETWLYGGVVAVACVNTHVSHVCRMVHSIVLYCVCVCVCVCVCACR